METICYCVLFISRQPVTRALKERCTEGRRVNSFFKLEWRHYCVREPADELYPIISLLKNSWIAMRYIAAYLLLSMSGKKNITVEDMKAVLESVSMCSPSFQAFSLPSLSSNVGNRKKTEGTLLPPTFFFQPLWIVENGEKMLTVLLSQRPPSRRTSSRLLSRAARLVTSTSSWLRASPCSPPSLAVLPLLLVLLPPVFLYFILLFVRSWFLCFLPFCSCWRCPCWGEEGGGKEGRGGGGGWPRLGPLRLSCTAPAASRGIKLIVQ